ncbi:hypothetical protein ACGFZS_38550 [Streptomyces sp. NPDC048288]|uniref:hypothetical protein n=1 Tax=Streptomyces sp. NPDC048288 TaxID=3365529 RepID=UPI003710D4C9
MSSVVKFFVAERVDAVAALSAGPDPSLSSLTYGNFDAEEALLDWESQFTGRRFDELVEEDFPEVVAEEDEGAVVLLLSDALVGALSAESESRVAEVAEWWVQEKDDQGWQIDLAVASEILQRLAGMARQERRAGEDIYCWVG